MIVTDRTDASDAEFRARFDRFGIFDEEERDLRTRMADVADNLDYYATKTDGGTYAGGLSDAAGHIRDALAGVQDGGAAAHTCSRWCADHAALGGPVDPS